MQKQLKYIEITKCVCRYRESAKTYKVNTYRDGEKKSNQIENLINKYYHKWNEFQTICMCAWHSKKATEKSQLVWVLQEALCDRENREFCLILSA